jgi:hypothetical protein
MCLFTFWKLLEPFGKRAGEFEFGIKTLNLIARFLKYFFKTGFPIADPKTGELIEKNKDLYCADKLCRDMHWRNYTNTASTFDASIGGPIQDTVLVPYGGYTVVRIQTDNPGKEIEMINRLFLVNCYLNVPARLPSQPASNVVGLLA